MIPGKRYTPQDALPIAMRRKWWLLAPLVLAVIPVTALLWYLPNMYWSETLILVVPQRVPESYVRSTVTARIEDRLQSLRQQILSRTRLERIVNEFDLYPQRRQTAPMEDVVAYMRNQVRVDMVRGDAFIIAFAAEDPAIAQKVVERLAGLAIEENTREREVMAEGTNAFLETQLEEARARLVGHEKKLETYRRAHIGELPTQAESNMQAIQALQQQVQGLSDSMQNDRDRLFVIDRDLAELPARVEAGIVPIAPGTGTPGPLDADSLSTGSAGERLAAARAALTNLQTRLKPEHPDVIRVKSMIRDLEAKVAEERQAAKTGQPVPTTAAPSQGQLRQAALGDERAMLTRQIQQKEAQVATLHRQIASYQAKLDAIPTRESEMTEMMRDYNTLQKVYTDLLAKREDSKVAANLEKRQVGEQFKIVDPPSRSERPYSPNHTLIIGGGFGGGLALGVLVVLFLELRDRTLRSESDVQLALKLPVLAIIPRMTNAAERAERRRRLLLAASAAVVMLAVVTAIAVRWMQ